MTWGTFGEEIQGVKTRPHIACNEKSDYMAPGQGNFESRTTLWTSFFSKVDPILHSAIITGHSQNKYVERVSREPREMALFVSEFSVMTEKRRAHKNSVFNITHTTSKDSR